MANTTAGIYQHKQRRLTALLCLLLAALLFQTSLLSAHQAGCCEVSHESTSHHAEHPCSDEIPAHETCPTCIGCGVSYLLPVDFSNLLPKSAVNAEQQTTQFASITPTPLFKPPRV